MDEPSIVENKMDDRQQNGRPKMGTTIWQRRKETGVEISLCGRVLSEDGKYHIEIRNSETCLAKTKQEQENHGKEW